MAETSTMSSKGQVVIPKRMREALQAAKPGAGYGLLKGRGRKVGLVAWDRELAKAVRRKHAGG